MTPVKDDTVERRWSGEMKKEQPLHSPKCTAVEANMKMAVVGGGPNDTAATLTTKTRVRRSKKI